MARNGPLVTLLAGAALGAGLLVASMAATPEQPVAADEPAADATGDPGEETAEPGPADAPEPGDTAGPDETAEPDDTAESDDTAEPDDSAEGTAEPDEAEPDESPEQTQPPAEQSEAVTYVGYVDSSAASVAVIVDGDEATAYVCDGNTREAWLSGTADGGALELAGDRGSLSASFDDFVAEGETTVDGQTWTFSIAQVEPPEGLYRFADTIAGGAEVVGGWIVLPDGTQVGAVNVDGETQQAEELDVASGEVTIEGDVVTAERQG